MGSIFKGSKYKKESKAGKQNLLAPTINKRHSMTSCSLLSQPLWAQDRTQRLSEFSADIQK